MDSAGDNAMHQHRHEGGEYRRIELITGVARRRRWTAEEKAALVAESLEPGINVSALARRRGVARGLLQTWRRAAMREATDRAGMFVPLRSEDAALGADSDQPTLTTASAAPSDVTAAAGAGMIEIESGGLRVRFSGQVDAAALHVVLAHVGRRA
jgi:transposase